MADSEKQHFQAPDLEARFLSFLKSVPDAESVDELGTPNIPEGVAIADFLLADRSIVAEVKSLKTDTAAKVEEVLRAHRDRPEFPVFYGEWPVEKVLAHLPDGEQIKAEIFAKISSSVERAFKKADDQIADTKRWFGLSDAWGLLFILNDAVDILSPEVLATKVAKMLTKKNSSGDVRYRQIQWVCIVSETHYTQVAPGLKAMPIIEVEGPTAIAYPRAVRTLDHLRSAWASYCGQSLFVEETKRVDDSAFRAFTLDKKETETLMPRHELWRRQYRANRYLSALDKPGLRDYGAKLFKEIKPNFLKGGSKAAPEQMRALTERWTHFLEEVNLRGLDMRDALPRDRLI